VHVVVVHIRVAKDRLYVPCVRQARQVMSQAVLAVLTVWLDRHRIPLDQLHVSSVLWVSTVQPVLSRYVSTVV
jgi:hypothetical protein